MVQFAFARCGSLRREDEGQALVDYSLMLLFVALACVVSLAAFGGALLQYYERVTAAWPTI